MNQPFQHVNDYFECVKELGSYNDFITFVLTTKNDFMADIETEIKQKRFNNEYLKAHVNVLFTASWLSNQIGVVLRDHNLSIQQFNVLRILRGASPHPTSVKELISRMIDKMSNASRLVDKLEEKGLVARTANELDRRRVDVVITQEGLELCNRSSLDVETKIDEVVGKLSTKEAAQLNQFLDIIRS